MAWHWFFILTLLGLVGCAELDNGLQKTADAMAPKDYVSGKRELNPVSEKEEISQAIQSRDKILAIARAQNIPVDTDKESLAQLQDIMSRIAKISHRPDLPWEIHLIESPDDNAFTVGGGKLFFFRGLFGGTVNGSNENEIAAVIAHEIGHVVARHIGKTQGQALAAVISDKAQKTLSRDLYKASFSTLQENDADKVGILYMALAGFDPTDAPSIWARADAKHGSDPKSWRYAYDHALNAERFSKTNTLSILALAYYKGQGIENPDYRQILESNKLTGKKRGDEGSGAASILTATLHTYTSHLDAKNEELSRQIKMNQDLLDAQRLSKVSYQIKDTTAGYRGIFGSFQNLSTRVVKGATVTVTYVNSAGTVMHTEDVPINDVTVYPGQSMQWTTLLKNVPGATGIRVQPTDITW
jgi:hypothetical protein